MGQVFQKMNDAIGVGSSTNCRDVRNGSICRSASLDSCSNIVSDDEELSQESQASSTQATQQHVEMEEANNFSNIAREIEDTQQEEREQFAHKQLEQTGRLYSFLQASNNAKTSSSHSNLNQRDIRARGACCQLMECDSNESYHTNILPLIAADVDANVVSTVVEYTDMKYHGVRLFAKLCYESFEELPSPNVIERQLRSAHTLVVECFPDMQKSLVVGVVRKWNAHLRYNNYAKTTAKPLLRCALAIVWPHIVVRDPNELWCFLATLNMRLTALNPEFANPVDASVLLMAQSRASLQTVFSHKVVNCKHCRVLSQQIGEYESSDEEHQTHDKSTSTTTHRWERKSEPCLCNGSKRKIKESAVSVMCDLVLCATNQQPLVTNVDRSTIQSLKAHSIIPTDFDTDVSKSVMFKAPPDAPRTTDPIAWVTNRRSPFGRDLLCAKDENKLQSKLMKLKTTHRLLPAKHIELYKLCTQLIRSVGSSSQTLKQPDGPYSSVVVQNIAINTSKQMLYVNVQGRGARFCFLHGAEHVAEDARVYFCINPNYYTVNVYCNNTECQKTITSYFDWMRKEHENRMPNKKKKQKLDNEFSNSEPNITKEARDVLCTKMHLEISIESNLREKLMFLALKKHYCGPKVPNLVLQPNPTMAVQLEDRKLEFDPDSSSDIETDPELNVKLPRHLLHAPMTNKLAYLKRKHDRLDAKKEKRNGASHCAFVRTTSKETHFKVSKQLIDASIEALSAQSLLL